MAHSAAILGVLKAIMKHPAPGAPLAFLSVDDSVSRIMFKVPLNWRALFNIEIPHETSGKHSTGHSRIDSVHGIQTIHLLHVGLGERSF